MEGVGVNWQNGISESLSSQSSQESDENSSQETEEKSGKPCWDMLEFTILDYSSKKNMLEKIDEMMKKYESYENYNDILAYMVKLYALQIKDNFHTKNLVETKKLISSLTMQNDQSTKENKEDLNDSINLYKVAKNLFTEFKKDKKDYGLLEIDFCILQKHKDIMGGKGGVFSTNDRYSVHRGKRHNYQKYETGDKAREAIQPLIDQYNKFINPIKALLKVNETRVHGIEKMLKLSGYFLSEFLKLHPFGDGNGRIARLLCSYAMLTFNPFLTPIYGIFSSSTRDQYLEALQEAQGGNLGKLVAILIDTNYYTWMAFHNAIKKKEAEQDWESALIKSVIKSKTDPITTHNAD